jgi:hypothetical protein
MRVTVSELESIIGRINRTAGVESGAIGSVRLYRDYGGYPVATGVQLLDRTTGLRLGFCHDHLADWQRDHADVFDTRLVIVGPLFAPRSDWACPVCVAGCQGCGADIGEPCRPLSTCSAD